MVNVLSWIVRASTYFIIGVMALMFIFVVGYFITDAIKKKKKKKNENGERNDKK